MKTFLHANKSQKNLETNSIQELKKIFRSNCKYLFRSECHWDVGQSCEEVSWRRSHSFRCFWGILNQEASVVWTFGTSTSELYFKFGGGIIWYYLNSWICSMAIRQHFFPFTSVWEFHVVGIRMWNNQISAPRNDFHSEKKRKDLAKYLFATETTDIFPLKCTDKNCVFNGSSSIFRFLTAITDKAEPWLAARNINAGMLNVKIKCILYMWFNFSRLNLESISFLVCFSE